MKTYFNMKTVHGIETVDELSRSDFGSYREYVTECRRLVAEYNLAGMPVYRSRRCAKHWEGGAV